MIDSDTIAAISSAIGPAARMILRLSGPRSHDIAHRIAGDLPPAASRATRVALAFNNLSFPAWLYLFSAPRSYNGEDLVELHIPGNPLLARLVLEQVISLGVRHATPGEFTARAFFSGRIDLSEAEGVATIISASNEFELRAARQLLAGELARQLRPMMDRLAETLALIEAGIDFSDQDITFLQTDEIRSRLIHLDNKLEDLLARSARFERLSHEPHFVLIGRPNAGKSTLLNTLAGHDRAIVSPIPGTTRDTLSAEIRLERGLIRLTDVAGLTPSGGSPDFGELSRAGAGREEGDLASSTEINAQMQSHALRILETADRIILLHDITDPRSPLNLPRAPDLLVLTKSDLNSGLRTQRSGLIISSHGGAGLPELRARLDQLAFGSTSAPSTLALNARHLAALADARAALLRAINDVNAGPELIALDLRESLDCLSQILGRLSPDELLGRIFSTFCIGK